jgi:FkbM family methyltransferase
MIPATFRHEVATTIKKFVYGRQGEPYRFAGHTLRYVPGTRPVRLRYASSDNIVAKYDALQAEWIGRNLHGGDTAIDVGAHYGAFAIMMAATCGALGHVVAFEPDPYARKVLMENVRLNPGVKAPVVESAACSDKAGRAVLFSRGGNSQSSLVRSAVEFSALNSAEPIEVELVTLDSYIRVAGLPSPRCVKIDAEGAEIRILRGATTLLAGDSAILCELHPYAWPEFGNSFAELQQIVSAHSRRIRYLDEQSEIGSDPKYGVVLLERWN